MDLSKYSAEDYLELLQALLPKGPAWTTDPDAWGTHMLQSWGDEFARFTERANNLIAEADWRTTREMLVDHERVAGLPDPCVTAELSIEQRQAALVSKMTSRGGQSRAYFIQLAESMGYPGATIDDGFTPMTCNSNCNDALWTVADRFHWRINLPSTGGTYQMTCNSNCNDALQKWGDEAIECRLRRYKPAHTTLAIAYV